MDAYENIHAPLLRLSCSYSLPGWADCLLSTSHELTAGETASQKQAPSQECVLTSEDYAVYSTILLDRGTSADKAALIVSDVTASPQNDLPDWQSRPPFKQVSDETLAHFNLRQSSFCRLNPRLDRTISYRLVSEEDLGKIFKKGGGGWQEFYNENPKSPGILHLSPVGYNSEGTEALVYVADNCGGLYGKGLLVRLAKGNGHWEVTDHMQLWIS